ncbi:MAG TPA: IS66 family transposase [Burkholderiaceae bacterium]|nr:IS66 family transposase [Burkholderiaceae bacterium]
MDEAWLQSLAEPVARAVLSRVVEDLKEARDRLNQNSENSSRPPGSRLPWENRRLTEVEEDGEATGCAEPRSSVLPAGEAVADVTSGADEASPRVRAKASSGRKPGQQPGAEGRGRTQKLVVHEVEHRHPAVCAACGRPLTASTGAVAYTGWDTIDVLPLAEGEVGLKLGVTRHLLHEAGCACGHRTRAGHDQAPPDTAWGEIELGEWRLLGPRLAAVVVLLTLRFRLSRIKVKELLAELFGLQLSTGLIDQTIRETGRAVAPLEAELVAEIEQAALVHADETSWREAGQALWLWVFVTAQTVLYQIGYRTQEIVINVLSAAFQGDLMTDGYAVYRSSPNRLRCWAHLMRKLVGLSESTHQRVAAIGQQLHAAFSGLQDAIYTARGSGDPPGALASDYATAIETFRHTLERHRNDPHEKLRAVAREFLLDWEVILRPLSDPSLPLTNNEAERALRHYVIARRISHGTRSELGSRAYALLASVIETCRRRGAVVLDFLGSVIAAARKGVALPALPAIQPVSP